MKRFYCCNITPMALRLIRSFDGDVVGNEAIVCNFSREEPSTDRHGNVIEGAFKIFFPNAQAICYSVSGEIAYVL